MFTKLRTITSHAGYGRYLGELDEEIAGYIPRPRDIPSPYYFSATRIVSRHHKDGAIVVFETSHRRYSVYRLDGAKIYGTEDEAFDAGRNA